SNVSNGQSESVYLRQPLLVGEGRDVTPQFIKCGVDAGMIEDEDAESDQR
ncbi:unnamed protein product, partial [Allacma fusca]